MELPIHKSNTALVAWFLEQVTYSDVYQHIPSKGDGNRKDSQSDRETRMVRDALKDHLNDLCRTPPFATAPVREWRNIKLPDGIKPADVWETVKMQQLIACGNNPFALLSVLQEIRSQLNRQD